MPVPEHRSSVGRLRIFWQRVTEGMQLEELWTQFASEARATYGFYSRDVDWEVVNRASRWRRPLYVARALFWALLMKLSPVRRVLLLLALVFLFFSEIEYQTQGHLRIQSGQLKGLSVAILLLLLALELADRVTMKRDLEIAREIQQWLVPAAPPAVPGLELAFATRPANTVAGDYYDAFLRPAKNAASQPSSGERASDGDNQRLLIVVADVAGKSVPAALLMATFQASLRALAALPGPLGELVARLNRYACAHSLEGRRFTTAFFAEVDPATRVLTYINAGHNPLVLRRASGALERFEAGGLPLGIQPGARYESGGAVLSLGDLLIVFTDGVIEAVNEAGAEFGETRLLERLRAAPPEDPGGVPSGGASNMLRHLLTDVDSFVGSARQHDDITCLVLHVV